MTDCRDEFPASWFENAKLSPGKPDCDLNYFGVHAGKPLRYWQEKGWIHPDDPRGWWGDIGDADGVELGSLLWTLWREKITAETLTRARAYCVDALQWMIGDGIARRVDVATERGGLYQISIAIEITKPDRTVVKYSYLWDGQQAAQAERQ